jgi:hypothetical protein
MSRRIIVALLVWLAAGMMQFDDAPVDYLAGKPFSGNPVWNQSRGAIESRRQSDKKSKS